MPHDMSQNQTPDRLIDAGLHLFGHKGFEGTSTRALTAHAETNIASIANHFGGKFGLYEACARMVAERVSRELEAPNMAYEQTTAEVALEQIECLVGAFVQLFVAAPHAHDMVAFMLRELTDPGDVTETINVEFIVPRHSALCDLWAKATRRAAEDEEIKLSVFATIGQILYFRITQPFAARRMALDIIGHNETRKVANVVLANLRESIERLRL